MLCSCVTPSCTPCRRTRVAITALYRRNRRSRQRSSSFSISQKKVRRNHHCGVTIAMQQERTMLVSRAVTSDVTLTIADLHRTATPVKPFKHSPEDPGPTDGADCVKPNGLHGRFAAALGLEGQAFQGKPAKAGASLGDSLNGEISIFRPGSNGSGRLHQRDPGCAEFQVQGATLHAPTTPGPRGVDLHLRSPSRELRSPLRTSIADTYTPLARGFTSISDTLRIEPRVCNHVLHQNPQSPDDSKKSKSASALKEGTSHVFVRPSSATRGGRDAADQMPLHWQSSVKRSSSSDGRSSRQSRQVVHGNSSAGSKLQGTTAVVQNEEGEPSPQMVVKLATLRHSHAAYVALDVTD
jgi:hypothetical protein